MTVQDKEVQQVVAATQDPSAKSAQDVHEDLTNTGAQASIGTVPAPPMVKPYDPSMGARGSASETNAAPPPGSFGAKLMEAGVDPAKYGDFLITGLKARMPFSLASVVGMAHTLKDSGSTEPQPNQQSAGELAGNVTWDQAQQNDTTPAINPNQIPKEDAAHKVQRGMAETLGNLFDFRPGSLSERGKQMAEENRTAALNALTNIQMVREQQLLHKGAEEERNKAAQIGADQFQMLSTAPDAKVIKEGISSDDLRAGLQGPNNPKGWFNPHQMQVFQTGRVMVGEDKTGTPQWRSSYSVLIPGGPITMGAPEGTDEKDWTDDQKKQEQNRQYINKFTNKNIQSGQTLGSTEWGALMQQANNNARAYEQRDNWLAAQDMKKKTAELDARDKDFLQKVTHQAAINQWTTDAQDPFGPQKEYYALKAAIARGDAQSEELLRKLGPDWEKQFSYTFGNHDATGKEWDARLEEYRKFQIKRQEVSDDIQAGGKTLIDHPEAVESLMRIPLTNAKADMDGANQTIASANQVLANANSSPEAKAQAQQQIAAAQDKYKEANARWTNIQARIQDAKNIMQTKVTEAGEKSGAEAKAKADAEAAAAKPAEAIPLTPEIQARIGTLPPEKQAILKQYDSNTQAALMGVAFGNGEVPLSIFPARLTKGAPGISQQQAYGVLSQLTDDKWSDQTYKAKMNMYKSATSGKLSAQADSVNNFIGHAAEARHINDAFYRLNAKIYDIARNKLATAGYGDQAVQLGEAIRVVNEEFETMIKSGFAPTAEMDKAQQTLVSENSTVGQINAALKVMAHMATVRLHSMNNDYKRPTGDAFPNLVYPDNVNDAKYLGIDLNGLNSGGRMAGSGESALVERNTTGTMNTNKPAPAGVGKFSITPPGMTEPIYFDTQEQLDAFKKKARL